MQYRELGIEKIIATVAFIFIILALCVIISTPPTTGYEISIYNAYPACFWFFLIATITCGVIILLNQAIAEKKSRWWLVGLAIIILANTIFLLLPEFRGYAIYGRGDTLTHLGYMKDILVTGHVSGSNFYPIVHILGASLIQVAGLSLEKTPSLFFVLFSGIYIINMCLLARSTANRSGQVLLAVAFSSPLIYSFFHANIHPNILSVFMVPCLLYFYQKREQLPCGQRQNTILLLLLAFLITFFHPVTALFVIIILLLFGLAHSLYFRFISRETSKADQHGNVGKNFLGVSLIILITFFMWYFSYVSVQRNFRAVYDWLIYQINTPLFNWTQVQLAKGGLTQLQTFELFMNRYGAIFLLLLISCIACIHVFMKSLSRKYNVEPMNFNYAALFLASLFIGVAMLFGYFVEYNPVRVARFPLLMGTILSGLVVYDFNRFFKRNTTKRRVPAQKLGFLIAIGVVIMSMVVLSIGNVYGSPRTCRYNAQVTQMEIVGTRWFERSKDSDIITMTDNPEIIRRFEDYNFGVDSFPITRAKVERVPSHFGYDEHSRIAGALDFEDRYLVIFELDKVAPMFFPENVRLKVHPYTEKDFAKLNSDPTVAKLYCNGEFEVWRVYGG